MMPVARKWGIRVALALAMVVALYAAAGTIGGWIPTNRGWRPPERGIRIFIESNGVHTGIVVPKLVAGDGWRVDWRPLVRADHLRDPRYGAYDHLSFGWGEHAFYLETPTWADVKPATVLAAAIGSDRTLVHVDHVPAPHVTGSARSVVLRPDEYRRLAAYIRATFAARPGHRPGYGPYDAFYDARGRYSAITTCNAWTGAALRHAGVRVGAWTPFPSTVMRWF